MKILYITPLWSGLKPFFYSSSLESSGMPAFYNVFINLLKDPKVEVIFIYLFVYGEYQEIKLPHEFKSKLIVKSIHVNSRFKLYISFIKTFASGISLVKKKNVDFIYGHGTISFIASLIGLITKTKHYRRIYGTFLYPKILDKKRIFLSNFFEYLSFKLPVDGLIITNDGTSGDKVFYYLNKKSSALHFLLNGIRKNKRDFNSVKGLVSEQRYFTYVARIDEWKRQHLLVEALAELQKNKINFPHTYLVGPIYCDEYKIILEKMIKRFNLSSKITILGAVSENEANYLLKNSILTFSLYDFSNLGNVFLEALSVGTPMLAINVYQSLDYFPEDIYYPIMSPDPIIIKDKIIEVMNSKEGNQTVKRKATKFAEQNILSWDERILIEKKIIFNN